MTQTRAQAQCRDSVTQRPRPDLLRPARSTSPRPFGRRGHVWAGCAPGDVSGPRGRLGAARPRRAVAGRRAGPSGRPWPCVVLVAAPAGICAGAAIPSRRSPADRYAAISAGRNAAISAGDHDGRPIRPGDGRPKCRHFGKRSGACGPLVSAGACRDLGTTPVRHHSLAVTQIRSGPPGPAVTVMVRERRPGRACQSL